jgi:hypothetical protein
MARGLYDADKSRRIGKILSDDFKRGNDKVPWRAIAGLRDVTLPEEYHESVREYFRDVAYDGPVDVVFTDDGGLAAYEMRGMDLSARPVILGSAWDDALVQNLGLPYIPISAPLGDYPICGKNYFGYEGGLSLFCEYFAACDKF